MALKTTKYYVEEMGITLDEAFAIAQPNTENGTAIFQIGASRELIEQGKIVKTEKIWGIKYPRNENPYFTAYKAAKTPIVVEDEGEEPITVYPKFYGWEDYMVEE